MPFRVTGLSFRLTAQTLRCALAISVFCMLAPSAIAQGMPGALQTALTAYRHCIKTNILHQSGNLSLTLSELQQMCAVERTEVETQTPENARQQVLTELDQLTILQLPSSNLKPSEPVTSESAAQ